MLFGDSNSCPLATLIDAPWRIYFMLFGDFNYSSIHLLTPNNTSLEGINDSLQAFVDESSLSQLVNVPTRCNNELDLVLFSDPNNNNNNI